MDAEATMTGLDWGVIVLYLLAMLVLAALIGRRQRHARDYFLASNHMSSGSLAASTIATQCSTNSLLGAPAFVGFVSGGGLLWLQYELAVPLAMAALLLFMVPARQAGVTSIYALLEDRLGVASRRVASGSFLIFRGVATGVTIYGVAIVLALLLDISFAAAVALLMAITVAYDLLGGIRAVVVSDVIQLGLLSVTVIVSLFLIADSVSWAAFFEARTNTLVNDWGFNGNDYGLWPMLIGGLFLYMAYYGCDQSQAQRVLAARGDAGVRRVLALNGFWRFPLVLSYCLLGLGLAAYAGGDTGFIAGLPATESGAPNYNLVFPAYVLENFAPGFVGLVMVGLLAAAMSSIDSAINSLSAATVEDFIKPFTRLSEKALLRASRLTTLGWGLFSLALSFQVEAIAPTVLEAINKVGSMANGPLLALFTVAVLLEGVRQRAALLGFAAGLAANLTVALALPDVSWLWWNVIGLVVAVAVSLIVNRVCGGQLRLARWRYPSWRSHVMSLTGMAAVILALCIAFDQLN